MITRISISSTAASALMLIDRRSQLDNGYAPGSKVQILALNAFPDHGKCADRLERAIASGTLPGSTGVRC